MQSPSTGINLSSLISELQSDNPNRQYDAARALGKAGASSVEAVGALIRLTGDTRYAGSDTAFGAKAAVEALSSIAQALDPQQEAVRGRIVNHIIDCCLASNARPAWAAIGELKVLGASGLMRAEETGKLAGLLQTHAHTYNISAWGTSIQQAIDAARAKPLIRDDIPLTSLRAAPSTASPEAGLTGKYGEEPGDLASELINSGRMTSEDRRALRLDMEAIEGGTSSEKP
jgi:hypothetical protein